MIGIVDTGIGNVLSVRRAIAAVTDEALGPWLDADKLVMAGQGSFASVDEDTKLALRTRINDGVPYLGICLGMQLLYKGSEEAPGVAGLGLVDGYVCKLGRIRMGWREVSHGRMYYCHGYQPFAGNAWIETVESGNVTGVQFHPEKSGKNGLDFLRRWIEGTR